MQNELMICRDLEELSGRAARFFARVCREGIASRGIATAALSGGSTPRALYRVLRRAPFDSGIPWEKVYFFMGDERMVPSDHPDSNFHLAEEHLFRHVSFPRKNAFPVRTELGDAERAASDYQEVLRGFFASRLPRFDLVLLGMGEDGHTASLFPGTEALEETGGAVVANYVERLRANRITLSVPAINEGRNILFLISGEEKAPALREVLEGPPDPRRLPSQLIRARNGRLVFMVDQPAAALLAGVTRGAAEYDFERGAMSSAGE